MGHDNYVETVIIRGVLAGTSVGYQLEIQDRDHIILEQAAQAANAWRNHRWESFALSTPKWQSQLPGAPLPRANPDGFSSRDEVVHYFEECIRENQIPIRYAVRVLAVKTNDGLYLMETTAGTFTGKNVVVATDICQRPQIPQFKGALSSEILQLHSDSYLEAIVPSLRSVLVIIGSRQSRPQIAEDSTRTVERFISALGARVGSRAVTAGRTSTGGATFSAFSSAQ